MRYLTLLFVLLISSVSFAQKDYVMKASSRNGVVSLRWAPTNYNAWKQGNKYGYLLERVTVLRNGVFPDTFEVKKMTQSPIRMAAAEDWEANIDDDMVAMAAQCLFDTLQAVSSPYEIYQQHSRKQQYFSLALYAADMSPLVADMSALSYTDKSVNKTERYLYRLRAAVPQGLSSDTALVFIAPEIDTELPKIRKPELISSDKTIVVAWETKYISNFFTSYIVEKSTDGISFSPINDKPSLQITQEEVMPDIMTFTDSIADVNTQYYYRVVGISCFGEKSAPSEVVSGHGLLTLNSSPMLSRPTIIDNTRVQLEWTIDEENADAVQGFRVYRRSGPKERLKMISDIKNSRQRNYVDNMPDITNYYRVSAYNANDEKMVEFDTYAELVDSIPPAIPVGVRGFIDSTGVATISWNPNTERDLYGYRVYSNNVPSGEFALQTSAPVRDTVFQQTVSLNTLSHTLYYTVRSVDVRGNTSEPSVILAVERPDTIPPTAPKMLKPTGVDGQAHVLWVRSYSDDVVSYLVLRRSEGQSVLVETVPAGENEQYDLYDPTAQYGIAYDYLVLSRDKAGNVSMSDAWRRLEMLAPEVAGPEIKLRSSAGCNELVVKMPSEIKGRTATHLLIYRSDNDGALRSYEKVELTKSYKDTSLSYGHKYGYAVRILFSDGSESGISELVKQKK